MAFLRWDNSFWKFPKRVQVSNRCWIVIDFMEERDFEATLQLYRETDVLYLAEPVALRRQLSQSLSFTARLENGRSN